MLTHPPLTSLILNATLIKYVRASPREGVSEVGVTSFIDFWNSCKFAADTAKKSENNCFFGDKIPHLESVFGCVPVLRSLIRILRATLVQIDTEMTKKYSNQRCAVDML